MTLRETRPLPSDLPKGEVMSLFAANKKGASATDTPARPDASARPDKPVRAGSTMRQSDRTPRDDQGLRTSRDRSTGASVLPQKLEIEGELRFSGKLQLECHVRGNIVADGTLIVGKAAVIEADILGGEIEIAGTVRGNVKATKTVRILSGGSVSGNIETPTISMQEGVVFEGTCTRPPESDNVDATTDDAE